MPFDVEKALKDGRSEDEILTHLSSHYPSFNTTEALKEKSKREVIDYLATLKRPSQDEVDKMGWATVLKRAKNNLPGDTINVLQDTIAPFLRPIDTAKAVKDLAVGTVQKLIPGEQGQEKKFDALIDGIKQEYGSLDRFKKTLSEQPAKVATDIGSFLLPAGKVVQGVGAVTKASKVGSVVNKAGQAISKVGANMDVLQQGTRIAKKGVGHLIPNEAPSKLFQSAAKLRSTLPMKDVKKLTQTALNQEVMLTVSGLDKLKGKIHKYNEEISTMIDAAGEKGKIVPIGRLLQGFNKLLKNAKFSGLPSDSARAVKNVRKQLLEANARIIKIKKEKLKNSKILKADGTPHKIKEEVMARQVVLEKQTLAELQKLKQGIYKETESYYSRATTSPASIKAQHLIARNAKEALEQYFPEIKHLNRKEGELISLMKEIERSANNISKRDLFSFGTSVRGAAGGALGHKTGAVAGLTLGLFDTPTVKNRLAIIAHKLQQKGIPISEKSAFVKLGLVQAGRVDKDDQ